MRLLSRSLLIMLAAILGCLEINHVRADTGACDFVGPLMLDKTDPMTPVSGARVAEADKKDPPNVVVLGQDLDQQVGVTISVQVEQISGTIQYDEYEPAEVCDYYKSYQPGKKSCSGYQSPNNPAYGYYYYDTIQICRRNYSSDQGIAVQRKIKDIKIWLEPDSKTSEWLGWSPVTGTGRSALRFLYPETWMVGYWTEGGFVTRWNDSNMRTNEDYDRQWLEQMKDYNFLAGGAMIDSSIWSVTLHEIRSPVNKDTTSLGLYGTFDTGPDLPEYMTGPTVSIPCPYWKSPSHAQDLGWTAGEKGIVHCDVAPTPDTASETNKTYTVALNHVPLDLPGNWTIGVMVEMAPAQFTSKYGNRTITEPTGWDAPTRWFKPASIYQSDEIGYNMSDDIHSFNSYILLSSPCNIQEKDGCFDGSP